MKAEEMYAEIIMDYYRNPRNKGSINSPSSISKDVNPACGDEIEIQLKINGDKIQDISFNGKGCAISQASASLLTESVKGKSLEDVKKLGKSDILEMLNIPISPIRIKCAILSLKVLKMATYQYMGEQMKEDFDLNGNLQ